MARATTASYDQLVLEISTDGGTTWSRICGFTDFRWNRTANADTSEIPDCDDESLPHEVERDVRSLERMLSGEGVWAQESHQTMLDWFNNGTQMDVRVGYLNADTGDTKYETGTAILTSLEHARTKGKKVSASIELQFSGAVTATAA